VKYRLALFLLLIFAGAYYWLKRPGGEAPAITIPAPVEAPTPPPSFVPKRLDTPRKGANTVLVPSPNAEVYKKLVPYRAIDGLAVAYGDVILGQLDEDAPDEGFHQPEAVRLWEEREIPYGIATTLPNPGRITDAITYLTKATNLVFVPLTDQHDGIVFEPGTENCLSALGKTGGRQPIRLSANCGRTEILHEILHALGFVHEHSRPDRDQYVEVLWKNVDAKYQDQFRAVPAALDDPSRGTPFDFESIMLYPSNLFGKEKGLETLRGRNGQQLSPTRERLSAGDLRRIRDSYR